MKITGTINKWNRWMQNKLVLLLGLKLIGWVNLGIAIG